MKLFLIITGLLALFIITIYFTIGFPIVVESQDNKHFIIEKKEIDKEGINPLENITFSQNDNLEIYLYLEQYDKTFLPKQLPSKKVLYTTDYVLIKEMQENFDFTCTGGDMSTLESYLIFRINKQIVFKTNIEIVDNRVGLQSSSYGWIEAKDPLKLINIFSNFKPAYLPIVFL